MCSINPDRLTTGIVDGVRILAERVEYLDENGRLITESPKDFKKRALKKRFASLDDFLKRWKSAERKQAIIEELENEGLSLDPLAEEVGKDLDPFDLICHVAFDQPALTRRERAENVRKNNVFTKYGPQARAVLEALDPECLWLADRGGRQGRARRAPCQVSESVHNFVLRALTMPKLTSVPKRPSPSSWH